MSSFSPWAKSIMEAKYSHENFGEKESWEDIADRVTHNVLGAVNAPMDQVEATANLIAKRKFMPGGRYLYAAGRPFHQTQNCITLFADDSRFGWAELMRKSTLALMTGAGIGVVYSRVREEGASVRKTGGNSTGPLALMQMINEAGRGIMQGGSRRSAIWAGLHWNHPDAHKFVQAKNWTPEVRALKEKDFLFPATLDQTNVSVILDDEFFNAYHDASHAKHTTAHAIYWATLRQMLKTAEPGFSIDVGENAGEHGRNACTELTTFDDSDVCNLGSVNMARIESLSEMREVVELATAFLLAGTVYSDVPYPEVDQVRSKNRRLGLGLMGLHEWLLVHGKPYGPDEDLELYMEEYERSSRYAVIYADKWSLSRPVKTRAIAPTGTIGIVAETTTGMEPILAAAYKRRYIKGQSVNYQYVLDPTAKRLVDAGVNPESIEDAYALAADPGRRVRFQAWLQRYVDHAISSTINLPAWGSEFNNEDRVQDFGNMLMKDLPNLRGITCYPDGSRSGQPLQSVPFQVAAQYEGEVFVEGGLDICDLSKGGSCGA